ncbi:CHAT domain-containing protein [Streptomyces sp. NPDC048504]|uniref:CHAT domain-containing protein n=1 Tax=Streptomyces sp. NPDC048504 TaxID=3365559 RepID=UPI00371BB703
MSTVNKLREVDSEDVRAISRMYQILDRKPLYASSLEHVISSVIEHYSQSTYSSLTRSLLSALTHETALRFDEIGRPEQANECRNMAEKWAVGDSDQVITWLRFSISDSSKLHELKPLTVDAIIRALLFEVDRSSPRLNRPLVLSEVAHAAFVTGNSLRLKTATDKLANAANSPGFQALIKYYESRILVAVGKLKESEPLVVEFEEMAAGIAKSDPAYGHTDFLRRHLKERSTITQDYTADESSAMGRAAVAMQRGDWQQAVEFNEQAAAELPLGALRSSMHGLAETARLMGGMLETSSAVNASLDRMALNNLFAARSLLPLENLLVHLFAQAVNIYESGDASAPVARVSDLLGEFRGGAGVGRGHGKSGYRSDALADLTLVDFLSHTTQAVTLSEVSDAFPEHHVVWVNFAEMQSGGHVIVTTTLRPGSPVPLVRRTPLSQSDGKALAQCLDEESEEAPPEAVARVRQMFFSDLGQASTQGARVLVVPDAPTWCMPWNELAPPSVEEIALSVSIAAAMRIPPPSSVDVPRLIGIFDEVDLHGSRKEVKALEDLAAAGYIHFTRAYSIDELRNKLESSRYDVLTVSVHGTTGNGIEYRMLLPDGPSSPAGLLQLQLPPTVVLGCCWSAKSSEQPDTTAAVLACLVAGASRVVGGLWAIDDEIAGDLLARMYEMHFLFRKPLAQALRSAHLTLDPEVRPGAAGLIVVGRI